MCKTPFLYHSGSQMYVYVGIQMRCFTNWEGDRGRVGRGKGESQKEGGKEAVHDQERKGRRERTD